MPPDSTRNRGVARPLLGRTIRTSLTLLNNRMHELTCVRTCGQALAKGFRDMASGLKSRTKRYAQEGDAVSAAAKNDH
jgi:hypothetical protein